MTGIRVRSLLIVMAFIFLNVRLANAQQPSLMNPYRSFNLSGTNYGAQQWERDHARTQVYKTVPNQTYQPVNRIVHRRRHQRW